MKIFLIASALSVMFLFSHNTNAGIITWDFTFEIDTVIDNSNDQWDNPTAVGDIVQASLSFDENITSDNSSNWYTIFDLTNTTFDIVTLTSDGWLANLSPMATATHQSSRDIFQMSSTYIKRNTSVGEINFEEMIFDFTDTTKHLDFPIDWSTKQLTFTYTMDADTTNSGIDVNVLGSLVSAVQRVSVPEPESLLLFIIASFGLVFRKLQK